MSLRKCVDTLELIVRKLMEIGQQMIGQINHSMRKFIASSHSLTHSLSLRHKLEFDLLSVYYIYKYMLLNVRNRKRDDEDEENFSRLETFFKQRETLDSHFAWAREVSDFIEFSILVSFCFYRFSC